MTEVTMTPKELAMELDTTPAKLRKFIRSLSDSRAGSGGRWALDSNDIEYITMRWNDRSTTATAPIWKDSID